MAQAAIGSTMAVLVSRDGSCEPRRLLIHIASTASAALMRISTIQHPHTGRASGFLMDCGLIKYLLFWPDVNVIQWTSE